jgi:acyl-coenzyme A thioesterase PaaI-like protein
MAMSTTPKHVPVTQATLDGYYDFLFAPWVKAMGLTDLKVSDGTASARLPQTSDLHWAGGAICGQALMSAIDTVASLAVGTGDRQRKGTASQRTQFLRPAAGEDLIITAKVLQAGSTITYLESHVTLAGSGKLVAHATLEFV